MHRVKDTKELLQIYRDAEGPTNRALAEQAWHEEVAHIFLRRLDFMHASQYAKFFKIISNAIKDSANCFVFLEQLDPNMSYTITCYSKSNKSSVQFRNIDDLRSNNTIPDEDQESRQYHITFMGDGGVPNTGKVDVSELARKYILRRKMSEPKGQDEEGEPEIDGEQRGKKRRMLDKGVSRPAYEQL
ncbi:hypothetical protein KVR01_002925 [Diaporthe batatas]|uniref:uncharacterized protein n=1 Tax=Diaporthe batatas TaxID=748121 RepID=UPI001D04A35A|nr:uncharacterized protein KVR01_002925 [Diaporthe batatas]KAG8167236.1 hypothetical protein KVR01_002925 [Diaporthe batatas]